MRWPSYVIVPTAKKKIIVIKVINLAAMVCSVLPKYYGLVDLYEI